MPKVVLITGVNRFLGSRLAGQLSLDPSVERIIGIDSIQPSRGDLPRLGRTEFVRADIRNPLIAKVIAQAQVDTVVHTPLLAARRTRGQSGGTTELALVGTMQLLSACQKSDSVGRVVVRSTTAVYGSGPSDPAVFTEDMHAIGYAPSGYAKDAVEVEGYVRGFARRRPDVPVTILRMASLIGPTIDSAICRYLAMPVVPTSLGFDPRLQLLHEADALEVLRLATLGDFPGVVNVAADGIVTLSQAVRRAGHMRLPVPSPAMALVAGLVRNSGVLEVSAEHASFLNYGRVVDTTRLRQLIGYRPNFTTAQALDSYLAGHAVLPRVAPAALQVAGAVAARVAAGRSMAGRSLATPTPTGVQ
jgi:UDP-glucose 4-epimerase